MSRKSACLGWYLVAGRLELVQAVQENVDARAPVRFGPTSTRSPILLRRRPNAARCLNVDVRIGKCPMPSIGSTYKPKLTKASGKYVGVLAAS